jgi:hypothetical protein
VFVDVQFDFRVHTDSNDLDTYIAIIPRNIILDLDTYLDMRPVSEVGWSFLFFLIRFFFSGIAFYKADKDLDKNKDKDKVKD